MEQCHKSLLIRLILSMWYITRTLRSSSYERSTIAFFMPLIDSQVQSGGWGGILPLQIWCKRWRTFFDMRRSNQLSIYNQTLFLTIPLWFNRSIILIKGSRRCWKLIDSTRHRFWSHFWYFRVFFCILYMISTFVSILRRYCIIF